MSWSVLVRRVLGRRRGRTLFSVVSVALGVTVFVAVSIGARNLSTAIRSGPTLDEAVVELAPVGVFDATVPDAAVAGVGSIPGVASVGSIVRIDAQVAPDGAVGEGVPLQLIGIDTPGLSDGELRMSARVASEIGVDRGSEALVTTATGTHRAVVVDVLDEVPGLVEFSVIANKTTVQEWAGTVAQVSGAFVVLEPGVSPDDWIETHRDDLGAFVPLTDTLASRAEEFFAGVEDSIAPIAGAALFVAGYLIFLTLRRDAQEQSSTHATMRVLGASPQQIASLIVIEAAVAAIAGTAAGLVLGVLGGAGVAEAMRQIFGFSVASVSPTTPIDIIAVGVALGVGVPILAALVPAIQASRADPVHGLRADPTVVVDRPRSGRLIGGAGALGVGIIATLVLPERLGWLPILTALFGAALLLPSAAAPIAGAVSRALSRVSPGAGELAAQDLARRTGHAAATMGLLAVTLAVAVMVATVSASQRPEFVRVLDANYGADRTIHFPDANPVSDTQLATLRSLPAIDSATPLAEGRIQVKTNNAGIRPLKIIDPSTYFDLADLAWTRGTNSEQAESLLKQGGAVAMAATIAADADVEPGDTVTLGTIDGPHDFTVAGIFNALGYGETVSVVIAQADAAASLGYRGATSVLANINSEPAALEQQLVEAGMLNTFSIPNDRIYNQILSQFDGINGLIIVILVITAAIGVLGLANTLIIDTLDRQREIGIMRAIGAKNRDVALLVLTRSLILTATASVGAVALGGILGATLINSAADDPLGLAASYRFPTVTTVVVLALAAVVGIGGSVQPIRRANKLDPTVALRRTA